jgi:imidazolonepropionase-like amidohydrolase
MAGCRSDNAQRVIALVGATVIDGTGAPPAPDQTILIEDERITAVGPEVVVPDNAAVLDVTGTTVIPGLIDMHGHMYALRHNQFAAYPKLFLAGGVTTAFSPGDFDPGGMIALRDAIARGEIVGSRIFTAGPYFDHAPSIVPWIEGVSSVAEALDKFASWRDRIDAVKLYAGITEQEIAGLIEAAHDAGLFVTGHLGGIPTRRAVALGIDGLEHGIFAIAEFSPHGPTAPINDQYCTLAELDLGSPIVDSLMSDLVQQGVYVTPTIVTMQAMHPEFDPVVADWERYLSDDVRAMLAERAEFLNARGAECLGRAVEKQLAFVGRLHGRGGVILVGTDPVTPELVPGFAFHRELQNLVAAGLTPLEAITAATANAAAALGLDEELGTIAPGRLADLVVVDGDPSVDIRSLSNIRLVLKSGDRYDPTALRQSVVGSIDVVGN